MQREQASLSVPVKEAARGLEPRPRGAVSQLLALQEFRMVLPNSFSLASVTFLESFSSFSFLSANSPSPQIFSVLDARLLPEFHSALGMLPLLTIFWFLALTTLPASHLEGAPLLRLQPKISWLSPFSLASETLMQSSFSSPAKP